MGPSLLVVVAGLSVVILLLLASYGSVRIGRAINCKLNARVHRKLPVGYQAGAIGIVLTLLLFLVWSVIRGVFVTNASGGLTLYRPTHKPLNVPFRVHGDLYLSDIECCISDQPQRLCQQRGVGYEMISSLEQLRGWVEIKTDGEALAYVRLQTNDDTWWSFPDCIFEIKSMDGAIKYSYEFGLVSTNGWVTPQWMHDHDIGAPTVVRTPSGWRIHRVCVQPNIDKSTLMNVTEDVGEDGSYHRKVDRFTVTPPNNLNWSHEMQG